mgnify:CR=1 FL=1
MSVDVEVVDGKVSVADGQTVVLLEDEEDIARRKVLRGQALAQVRVPAGRGCE